VNLAELVVRHPAGDRALHDGERWTTWGELRARAASVASALAAAELEEGARVAVIRPTSVEFVADYLGVLAAGAVAAPLNPQSPPAELADELVRLEPSMVLCDEDVAGAVAAAHGHRSGDVPRFHVAPSTPSTELELSVADRRSGDPAALLFTSGTAGAPRAAVLSHGNLRANLDQMLSLPGEIARSDDIGLTAVPLFHIFGLNVALGLTLATGGALVLEERFDPAVSLELAGSLGVTTLVGVPPMYAAWAELADGELRSVRLAVSGAASLPAELASRFEERTRVPLWQGYGLTEASPAVTTALGTGRNRPGSVGRPLPGVQLRLVDEGGSDVLEGDPGEIWVRGPNVFGGYWRDAAATAEVLTGDGWLRTGDIGVLGDEGDLFVVDRRKDLVIVSGFNVFPGEIEDVARQVPGVDDAVAVGRPDPVTGEALELFIVRDPTAPPVSEADITEACGVALARYKCPAGVHFVDELPKGLAGKALRRALRQRLAG
jgi:long-chain acyl-CoA synthetase